MTAPIRVLVYGIAPDLGHLRLTLDAVVGDSPAELLYVAGSPASEAANRIWIERRWPVYGAGELPTIPVLATWHLLELKPDVILVCQPITTRDPLAAGLRYVGREREGKTVRDLNPA